MSEIRRAVVTAGDDFRYALLRLVELLSCVAVSDRTAEGAPTKPDTQTVTVGVT